MQLYSVNGKAGGKRSHLWFTPNLKLLYGRPNIILNQNALLHKTAQPSSLPVQLGQTKACDCVCRCFHLSFIIHAPLRLRCSAEYQSSPERLIKFYGYVREVKLFQVIISKTYTTNQSCYQELYVQGKGQ